ncbi:hypothetical protein [Burkholderia sp. 22313]|uniref:hypothetical protein n=1 Tax=Burkholderia sp. 22313 TaxID=3453908 RepID=UPI003F871588
MERIDVVDAGVAVGACSAVEATVAVVVSSDEDDGGGDPDPDGGRSRSWSLSAVAYEGLTVHTPSGNASLAVVDPDGNIIASGPDVLRAAWEISVLAYRAFLTGSGHLRLHTQAPGLQQG